MSHTRLLAILAFFFSFGMIVLGDSLQKRQTTDLDSILGTLKSLTGTLAPELEAMAKNGSASDATVEPIVNQLVDALNTANSEISFLSPARVKRQEANLNETAEMLAGIITDIANGFGAVQSEASSQVPSLPIFMNAIDDPITTILGAVELLLAGVLGLVATLVSAVVGLLDALALGLLVAALLSFL